MKEEKIDVLQVLANDKNSIPYRPELNCLTGGHITATILLQQIVYWWYKNGRKKFYKFKEPQQKGKYHKLYNKGDSWCEELGIKEKTFDAAIKRIGFKLGKTKNTIKKEDAFVFYYTDKSRVTYYVLNEGILRKSLSRVYSIREEQGDTSYTETTPETTFKEQNSENLKKEDKDFMGKEKSFAKKKELSDKVKVIGEDIQGKLVEKIEKGNPKAGMNFYGGLYKERTGITCNSTSLNVHLMKSVIDIIIKNEIDFTKFFYSLFEQWELYQKHFFAATGVRHPELKFIIKNISPLIEIYKNVACKQEENKDIKCKFNLEA